MSGFDDAAFFGDRWADHYGDGPDPTAAVEFLAGLAGAGRVLELASGTGRITLPLAARGIAVEGVEGSAAMVERMRERPGGTRIPVTVGDMADVPVEGSFRLVFLVFNTLFNLPSQERQMDCFHNVARALQPDGAFVIECFVPDPAKFDRGSRVEALEVTEDSATIQVYRHDAVAQRYAKQTITFTTDETRMLPVALRYCWPSELDLMASQAGLQLHERHADWDRRPFDSNSTSHISVYRPAAEVTR
ncbi:methyltransferase family protein [Nonomuraea polychroma]|uniref:Methyltransferase family protein n=1 Tax=Nonomuraea polychroma TaxID=46176 RepID=A0A438M8A9_9ACTN|nr:class I SAM-dependent methyltransferase [Nonomuraea polychroma]RVX41855.1 methyltransferase family protein [Nonomuraea polychroma]